MTWHAKHEEHIQHKRLIICSSSSTRHPLHQLIHLKDRMTTTGMVLCSIDYPKTKLGVITEVTTQPVDHDMSYNCTRPELFFFFKNKTKTSLSLVGNLGHLTWVRNSSHKSSVTYSYQCSQ